MTSPSPADPRDDLTLLAARLSAEVLVLTERVRRRHPTSVPEATLDAAWDGVERLREWLVARGATP